MFGCGSKHIFAGQVHNSNNPLNNILQNLHIHMPKNLSLAVKHIVTSFSHAKKSCKLLHPTKLNTIKIT